MGKIIIETNDNGGRAVYSGNLADFRKFRKYILGKDDGDFLKALKDLGIDDIDPDFGESVGDEKDIDPGFGDHVGFNGSDPRQERVDKRFSELYKKLFGEEEKKEKEKEPRKAERLTWKEAREIMKKGGVVCCERWKKDLMWYVPEYTIERSVKDPVLNTLTVVNGPFNGGGWYRRVNYDAAEGTKGLASVCDNYSPLPAEMSSQWYEVQIDKDTKDAVEIADVIRDIGEQLGIKDMTEYADELSRNLRKMRKKG